MPGAVPDALSIEELQHTVDVFLKNARSISATAKEFNVNRSCIRHRLRRAVSLNLVEWEPAAPGYEISHIKTTRGKDGTIKSKTVTQRQEDGDEFKLPEGYEYSHGTFHVGPDNRVKQHWPRVKERQRNPVEIAKEVRRVFEDWEPKFPTIITPDVCVNEMFTVYIINDWHMGMHAWAEETQDLDWNLKTATSTINDAFEELIYSTPKSKQALILGLGDLLHADSLKTATPTSNNPLDVDNRFPKVLTKTRDLLADNIERTAVKHEKVEVCLKRGNHDPNATTALSSGLWGMFRKETRIMVDENPASFYWKRHGINLIGGHHGHDIKLEDMPLYMANKCKEDWSVAKTYHFHSGHRHHQRSLEVGGVVIWSHRAPIPKDAFHADRAYTSGRSMQAFNYHTDKGSRGSTEIELHAS